MSERTCLAQSYLRSAHTSASSQAKVNEMLNTINSKIMAFRPCFSREAAFGWFVIVVFSFMVRDDGLGVSSIVRDLMLPASHYLSLIHFFHADSWSLDCIRRRWCELVAGNENLMKCNGRAVLIGDGVKQSKEGLRMPGVVRLVQESGTVSKLEYIFGHMFGAVGVVLQGEGFKKFCLPLYITIQQGLWFMHLWNGMDKEPPGSHVEQVIDCVENRIKLVTAVFCWSSLPGLSQIAGHISNRILQQASVAASPRRALRYALATCSRQNGSSTLQS